MKKLLTQATLCAVMLVTTTQVAFSAPISTATNLTASQTVEINTAAATDQARVATWLQRDDVRQQLVHYGVSPTEAQARLANLSDQDLARVNAQIDKAPAGSSVLALIGAVFLVLIILEVVGVIDIFKKV